MVQVLVNCMGDVLGKQASGWPWKGHLVPEGGRGQQSFPSSEDSGSMTHLEREGHEGLICYIRRPVEGLWRAVSPEAFNPSVGGSMGLPVCRTALFVMCDPSTALGRGCRHVDRIS